MNADIPVDRALAAATILRHPAPPPSPAEQAVIDRFGIFEAEERVAAAILRAVLGTTVGGLVLDGDLPAGEIARLIREAAATAAIAAMPAHPAESAVKRIEHLIDLETGMAWPLHGDRVFRERDIRAALAPLAGQHATDEEAAR